MACLLRAGEAVTRREHMEVGWEYHGPYGPPIYRLVLWNEVTGYCEVVCDPYKHRIRMTEGQLRQMHASPPPSGQRWRRGR